MLYVVSNYNSSEAKGGWFDTSLIVPKVTLEHRGIINMPTFSCTTSDYLYCTCDYYAYNETIRLNTHRYVTTDISGSSTLYVYYR